MEILGYFQGMREVRKEERWVNNIVEIGDIIYGCPLWVNDESFRNTQLQCLSLPQYHPPNLLIRLLISGMEGSILYFEMILK